MPRPESSSTTPAFTRSFKAGNPVFVQPISTLSQADPRDEAWIGLISRFRSSAASRWALVRALILSNRVFVQPISTLSQAGPRDDTWIGLISRFRSSVASRWALVRALILSSVGSSSGPVGGVDTG
jgi:hypothetical protein